MAVTNHRMGPWCHFFCNVQHNIHHICILEKEVPVIHWTKGGKCKGIPGLVRLSFICIIHPFSMSEVPEGSADVVAQEFEAMVLPPPLKVSLSTLRNQRGNVVIVSEPYHQIAVFSPDLHWAMCTKVLDSDPFDHPVSLDVVQRRLPSGGFKVYLVSASRMSGEGAGARTGAGISPSARVNCVKLKHCCTASTVKWALLWTSRKDELGSDW